MNHPAKQITFSSRRPSPAKGEAKRQLVQYRRREGKRSTEDAPTRQVSHYTGYAD